MRLCLSPNGVGAPSLLRSAAVGTSTLRRHRPAVMLDLPPALEVDGLVALTLPVLLVPTLIFVVATIGPLLQPRQRGDARLFETRARQAVSTLLRIGIPSLLAAVAGFFYFDNLSLYISSTLDVRTLSVLARDNDSGQFIQNFTTVAGTLFAILAGNAYADLYAQQEEIYFAVYREVTTAKLLLEQLTLVGQARPWYPAALRCMREYLNDDLRRTDVVPSERLSAQRASTVAKPADDPLEAIMRMTSVGVPSGLYETVRDLRQARGARLGAQQRKFPALGLQLLYVLAGLEIFSFPLLAAGTASLSEDPQLLTVSILELQSVIFASLCACVVLVLRIIQELWRTSGGVFNVDEVLQQLSIGLDEELQLRMRALQPPNEREGVEVASIWPGT